MAPDGRHWRARCQWACRQFARAERCATALCSADFNRSGEARGERARGNRRRAAVAALRGARARPGARQDGPRRSPRVRRAEPIERDPLGRVRARLRELGYAEERDVAFETRWAEGRTDRLPRLARELIE